jgi:hypothetical protein
VDSEDISCIAALMSGVADGKEQVTAQINAELARYIFKRAERLGWRRAQLVGAIINKWHEAGCPEVHELDAVLPGVPGKHKVRKGASGSESGSEKRSAEAGASRSDA